MLTSYHVSSCYCHPPPPDHLQNQSFQNSMSNGSIGMVESVPCSFPEIPGMRRGRTLVLASAQGKMLSFTSDLHCGQLAMTRKSG